MKKYCVLYNKASGSGFGESYARKLENLLKDELYFVSMPSITDFKKFMQDTKEDIIICGGDGTLNYFLNHIQGMKYRNKILYYGAGTGNDFYKDVGDHNDFPINIDKYIKNLPVITVKNKEYVCINGVGLGLDGFCCALGETEKRKYGRKINYTKLALRGLLYAYKPRKAKVIVDGEKYNFSRVWMVSVMNGKYYGGGMMLAPNQERLNKENTLSLVVVHNASRLDLIPLLPTIFKGNHVKYTKYVTTITGHNFEIEFDKPCAMQMDGEPISDVIEYQVSSNY